METILYNRSDSPISAIVLSQRVATIAGEWFPYDRYDHRTLFFQRSKGKPDLARNMCFGIVVQPS